MIRKLLLYSTLCYSMLSLVPAEASHFPGLIVVDGEEIVCSGVNLKVEPSGRVLAVTASHCLRETKRFDTVLGVWVRTGEVNVRVWDGVTGKLLGVAVPVLRQGDLGLIAYVPTVQVTTLPYARSLPVLTFGSLVTACGGIVQGPNPEITPVQFICTIGFWLADTIMHENQPFMLVQTPVRSGQSGGPIFYKGQVIGIYSLQIISGNVVGMTPILVAIPYLEGIK